MNKKILDFIRHLSEEDPKDLAQKALKVSEEAGELAKSVLAYTGAAGSTHKFTAKEKILEQAIDVILSAISLPHSMKFSDEEIEEMLEKKSNYWQQLQAKEKKVTYPLPYEIHVTIEKPDDIEGFKERCHAISVKPIVIDLEQQSQTVKIDVMTSSVYYGDNKGAYDQLKFISNFLKTVGYKVIREKIETVPWHPAAPSKTDLNPKMPKDCYFEAHIDARTTITRKKDLEEIAQKHKAHLSRNFFKKIDNDQYINMVTLRKYDGTIDEFNVLLESLKKDLTDNYFTFEKPVVEFSIYDTKVSHDFAWVNS